VVGVIHNLCDAIPQQLDEQGDPGKRKQTERTRDAGEMTLQLRFSKMPNKEESHLEIGEKGFLKT